MAGILLAEPPTLNLDPNSPTLFQSTPTHSSVQHAVYDALRADGTTRCASSRSIFPLSWLTPTPATASCPQIDPIPGFGADWINMLSTRHLHSAEAVGALPQPCPVSQRTVSSAAIEGMEALLDAVMRSITSAGEMGALSI